MRLKSIFLFLVIIFCSTAHALPPGKIPNVYGITYDTDAYIRYGTHEDSLCGFNSDQGDGGLTCGVASAGQFFLLMDKADLAVDSGVTDLGTPQFVVANSDPTKWVTMYHNGTNAVIHTNTGVVTFPEGIDLGSSGMSFGASLTFEGATADAFETTLTVVDPTGDNTITLPNSSGAVILSAAGIANTANAIWGAGAGTLSFEGATADAFETSIQVADTTTGDKTFTLPDQTGTAIVSVGGNVDAANAISGGTGTFIFEGTTADAFETTFGVVDPTADAAWSVPNFATNAAFLGSTLTTNTVDAANSVWGSSNGVTFEGATADGFETTLTVQDPSGSDQTVTIPSRTGTLVLNSDCRQVVSVEINPTEAGATNDYINLVDNTFSATETDEDMFYVPVNMIARDMVAVVDVAPGAGNDDWKIHIRDDASNSGLSCTIDEVATTCNGVGTANINALSKLDILVDSSGGGADPTAAAALTIAFCLVTP